MTRLWAQGDPVQVVLGVNGAPVKFLWRGGWREVDLIANRWRVRSSWWLSTADAHREYVRLTTVDGLLCTLYHDLKTGAWYCARIFD